MARWLGNRDRRTSMMIKEQRRVEEESEARERPRDTRLVASSECGVGGEVVDEVEDEWLDEAVSF